MFVGKGEDYMPDIAISKDVAVSQIDKISADVDIFLADKETSYNALKDGLADSQGDFVEALKTQLEVEKTFIHETVNFYKTLLAMMKNAEADFETTDTKYASTNGF